MDKCGSSTGFELLSTGWFSIVWKMLDVDIGTYVTTQVTWDIVVANPDVIWSYTSLSRNPNITWDIVQSTPDKDPGQGPRTRTGATAS